MTNISNVLDTPSMPDTSSIADITPIKTESIVEGLSYDTSMVSKSLGVQESTLRKYCALMKQHNYEFNTNAAGHRIFYKKDIDTIRKIVEQKNSGSLTLAQSVKAILKSDIDNMSNEKMNAAEPSNEALIEAFNSFKQEQIEFNQQLINEIAKQQEYIKNGIEERDRKLMFAIKESMEIRRQLAATTEEEKETEKKKAKWWQFWK